MGYLVREYQDADRAKLIAAAQRQFASDDDYPLAPAVGEDIADWLFKDIGARRWVAVADNKVIGHMQVTPAHDYFAKGGAELAALLPDLLEIGKLFVLADYRNMGVATALIEVAINEAGAAGKSIILATFPHLTKAIALYRDLGFRCIGAFPGKYVQNVIYFLRP